LNTAGGASFFTPGARPFSRNNVFHSDGTLYDAGVVADHNLKHAFGDYEHPTGGPDLDVSIFRNLKAETANEGVQDSDEFFVVTPNPSMETVPKTWEE